jgi:hypothetical protein
MPHNIKLYQQYKGKDFEIIGIADDDSKPKSGTRRLNKMKLAFGSMFYVGQNSMGQILILAKM